MKRAFLFDMDGVIVDSEQKWHMHGKEFIEDLYGKDILQRMEDTTGMSLDREYEFATKLGFSMGLEEYYERYDAQATKIYDKTVITHGLEDLIQNLKEMDFQVGIVSSSRKPWIEMVLKKIEDKNLFDYVLSLNEMGLPSKPHPIGYMKAMEDLSTE